MFISYFLYHDSEESVGEQSDNKSALVHIKIQAKLSQVAPKQGLNKSSRWAASGLTGNRLARLSDPIPSEGDQSKD